MAVDKSSEKSVRFSAMDSNGGDIKLFLVMVSNFITIATSGLINKQYNFLQGVPIMPWAPTCMYYWWSQYWVGEVYG